MYWIFKCIYTVKNCELNYIFGFTNSNAMNAKNVYVGSTVKLMYDNYNRKIENCLSLILSMFYKYTLVAGISTFSFEKSRLSF